jgi:CO/xanthine dehydrogenase FAD-binding subunit
MAYRPENYYRPTNLEETLNLLAQPDVYPLAGGTQLLAGDDKTAVTGVVDLQALGLNQIKVANDILHIGATAVLTDLYDFLGAELAAADFTPLLQQAIKQAGPNTYRNAATLGGVAAGRLPDSELLAALLVLDAQLSLRTPDTAVISLADYLGTDEAPNGLITDIFFAMAPGAGSSERVARTPADTPIVSITCWQPSGGTPRLAATGIGVRPFRLQAAEEILADGMTDTAVASAAQAVQAANTHPGDFRGSAAYRGEMAAVLTRRILAAV